MRHLSFLFALLMGCFCQAVPTPNIVLIMTDDQGYGDLGLHGNPHVQTPNLDAFARDSVAMLNFQVSPVCSPTRSSLMTGRYSLRTGIRDTYKGGSLMSPDEITIAEMLRLVGYTTGVFGKWHLGDSYPGRPIDQGFDESVVHLSGGMGQPGDFTTWPKKERSYFDPVLWHNGGRKAFSGYCSDIFTQEAVRFIRENKSRPFFCYLSYNAPHTPLQVPDTYYDRYRKIDPASGLGEDEQPTRKMKDKDKEDARLVYAMVSNIDDNVGKVLQALEELGLEKNTLVIFMTDNGPQQTRFNAGLRGLKSSVYRGGIHVPFYWRYPAFKAEVDKIHTTLAHIDLLPTLAEICGAPLPADRIIDGRSFLPLLKGETVEWENRLLFHYWTRQYPILYDNIAVQRGSFKLVGNTRANAPLEAFELYNLGSDPRELNNVIAQHPDIAAKLKLEMDLMYKELVASPNLVDPPSIHLGTPYENPLYLNRNDAADPRRKGSREEIYGQWRVKVEAGYYDLRFQFVDPLPAGGTLFLEAGSQLFKVMNREDGCLSMEMKNVWLPAMERDFTPYYRTGRNYIWPFVIEVERTDL